VKPKYVGKGKTPGGSACVDQQKPRGGNGNQKKGETSFVQKTSESGEDRNAGPDTTGRGSWCKSQKTFEEGRRGLNTPWGRHKRPVRKTGEGHEKTS